MPEAPQTVCALGMTMPCITSSSVATALMGGTALAWAGGLSQPPGSSNEHNNNWPILIDLFDIVFEPAWPAADSGTTMKFMMRYNSSP